jgi:tripartite-type tricarboxylate transporter receptor subunit TctC
MNTFSNLGRYATFIHAVQRGASMRRLALMSALLFSWVVVSPAHGQAAEKQPLKIIVATAPGGVPDGLARIIGQQITQDTGRPVIVENRLGAGGLVAMSALANSPADGNTVVLVEGGSYAIAPHMSRINPFEGNAAPVALVATAPIFLCVNPKLGVNTIKEFIALAKAKPGMPYGSSGNGSSHQLAMEFLKSKAGIDLTHIPYKGAGQSVLAVISGEVSSAFLGMSTALPQSNAGKLKILAVASAKRNPLLPEIPSIAEAGGPNSDMRIALGVFANARTPAPLVNHLNQLFGSATKVPAVKAKLAQMGIESSDGTTSARQFAAMVKSEYEQYGEVVKSLNLKID